ncbi:hypothetical protein [Corynebacterium cystitidis]|uniref:hypothetical protein n=1 Tax=Corynebacterium cystitidis TaxID=35757 RepID=UPI00211E4D63|nr:hypothetical protein [Corynebacterium cystitidis]
MKVDSYADACRRVVESTWVPNEFIDPVGLESSDRFLVPAADEADEGTPAHYVMKDSGELITLAGGEGIEIIREFVKLYGDNEVSF